MSFFKRLWKLTPDDAARLGVAALAMPFVFILPNLLLSSQTHTRIVLSILLGALGVYLGLAVSTLRTGNGCRIDNAGYAIGICSAASAMAAIGSVVTLDDPTMTWRTITAGTQGCVVLGWLALWRLSGKWLAKTFSRWAFWASACGLVIYGITNFILPDPTIAEPWAWGTLQPRGITARTMGAVGAFLEPALGVALWGIVAWTWYRYVDRHGGSGQRSGRA